MLPRTVEFTEDETFRILKCLTNNVADKRIVNYYNIQIATVGIWKDKKISDEDYWKKIIFTYFAKYNEKKDSTCIADIIKERNLTIDRKKNMAIMGISEKDYNKLTFSKKYFNKFILNLLDKTPTDILYLRIKFLKEFMQPNNQDFATVS